MVFHTQRHNTSSAGREKMGKKKEKLILDREIKEALRKGAKPEEHSSALPPYGFYIPTDASPSLAQRNPGYTQCTSLPLFPVLPKKPICTSRLPTWKAKGNTHSLITQSGTSHARIIAAEDAAGTDPKWTSKPGDVILKEHVRPEFSTTIHEEPDGYVLRKRKELNRLVYEGPVRIIRTTVGYQNLARGGYCVHLSEQERFKHPLRTTVRVTAKLSMQGDYQWTESHLTVPVGALVPQ